MKTTLNQIKAKQPCTEGWRKLLKYLGKTTADDEPLAITTILDSNGLDDAIWCLRAVEGHDREIRLFAVDCVLEVKHLLTDACSITALDVATKFAHGQCPLATLDAAWAAAVDAARNAAWAAAWDAARDAARAVAWAAAVDAAVDAARDAARDAAWAAAVDAARAAARDKQGQLLRKWCAVE